MVGLTRTSALATIGALPAVAACSGNPPPVSLQADTESLDRLRGTWRGQYWSEGTGRRGTIRFELAATGDTARGDVVMMPARRDEPLRPFETDPERAGPAEPRSPEFLRIYFVRCRQGHVHGTLDAYRDPETGHPLVTTFHGEVHGDSIGGDYSSYDRVTGRRAGGEWYVLRRR